MDYVIKYVKLWEPKTTIPIPDNYYNICYKINLIRASRTIYFRNTFMETFCGNSQKNYHDSRDILTKKSLLWLYKHKSI